MCCFKRRAIFINRSPRAVLLYLSFVRLLSIRTLAHSQAEAERLKAGYWLVGRRVGSWLLQPALCLVKASEAIGCGGSQGMDGSRGV
jgi:hypothetical protein